MNKLLAGAGLVAIASAIVGSAWLASRLVASLL